MISSLELARLCGVSQGTVDRALHGRPGISAATRERVLAAARAHGYLPNPTAREMMGLARSPVIGVVMPESGMRVTFFMDLIAELTNHLRPAGLRLTLWPCASDEWQVIPGEIMARRPRAMLLLLPPEDLLLPPSLVRDAPVISLLLPTRTPGARTLVPDEHAIGHAATAHLLALGHRRILHLSGVTQHWASRERAAGYTAAMAAAGCAPLIMPGNGADPAVFAEVLASGCTAVFCHHDPMAWALIRLARQAGLAVPGALSVIGVDRSPTAFAFDPTLTSVAYPYAGIAAQVAAVILGQPLPPLPPVQVVAGATSAPPGLDPH